MPDANLPVRRDFPTPLVPNRPARQRPRASVVWGLMCGLAVGLGLGLLLTIRRGAAPSVHVGPVIVAEPSIATPLPIQVGPSELIPQGGWIRITGLPPLATLSEGHAIAPGFWRVPAAKLLGLAITAPSGEGIRSNVSIALMSPRGSVLAEVRSMLVVIPASRFLPTHGHPTGLRPSGLEMACPEVAASKYAGAGLGPSEPSPGQGEKQRAEMLVRSGDNRLANGNVAAAREYYRRAAEMGWSPAAFALGATYDPHEALRGRILGVSADLQKARCWYARARELADMEAASQPR
jgi:hypothetical protein